MTSSFINEPLLDLSSPDVHERFTGALAALDARLPLAAPSIVGGRTAAPDGLVSVDPARPERTVAVADCASAALVEEAVELAAGAGRVWSETPPDERAAVLFRAAELVADERAELAALMVRETAKPWDEADGEVAEAIDFLRFYAEAPARLERRLALPGDARERNAVRLVPRGVAAAITPWNFPFAIPLGVAVAALAGGNPVVLKPAEQAPASGAAVVRILHAAGVPPEALALVQGDGAAGAALAAHPAVATIGFTGSVDVGMALARVAGDTAPGQRQFKRLVAELGGKNCAIVAADANLEAVADWLIPSAFSFAGQKCSAVSRVLVERPAAEPLGELLSERVAALRVGPGERFETTVPPLIERSAQERLAGAAAEAERDGTVLARAPLPEDGGDGYYVAPTLVTGLAEDHPLTRRELFGPLVSLEPVADVDAACDRVDALRQGLVGGLYTTSEATVEHVLRRSPVGNLYVNRPTVGALVGRQPFGGSRLSGTGHKSGGEGYLAGFCEQQVVAIRHPA
jgi:RHH-type transcriptional regulator, proline utilization regulon repressor / proline dehydrogenase / delta 1-pyrroline-5-carboxylate dehydrogenase